MSSSATIMERLDNGIVLRKLDDLCFVHFGNRSVAASQTRQLSEKLIEFIERGGCRKLVISFDGIENIYGFLVDRFSYRPSANPGDRPTPPPASPAAASDLWVG